MRFLARSGRRPGVAVLAVTVKANLERSDKKTESVTWGRRRHQERPDVMV